MDKKYLFKLSLKREVSSKPLPLELRGLCLRGDRKMVRARGDEGHETVKVFWIPQHQCSYELMEMEQQVQGLRGSTPVEIFRAERRRDMLHP